MKNIELNAGGLIGALACGGAAAGVAFSMIDQAGTSGRGPYKFIIASLVGGAFAGNFIWDMAFKKSKRGRKTSSRGARNGRE